MKIEWLEQKANAAGELAQDYLSNHDTAGYARYSDAADYRNCGATVSFDNPLANHKAEMTHIFWNNRSNKEG